MLMDVAPHNDSSFLPIFPIVINGKYPVVGVRHFVELIAWMRRASLPCAPTADITFGSFQVGTDFPASIFHKEVEIRGAFQLEHLQRKMKV